MRYNYKIKRLSCKQPFLFFRISRMSYLEALIHWSSRVDIHRCPVMPRIQRWILCGSAKALVLDCAPLCASSLLHESSQMSRILICAVDLAGQALGQDAEKTRAVMPEFKSISFELSAEICESFFSDCDVCFQRADHSFICADALKRFKSFFQLS